MNSPIASRSILRWLNICTFSLLLLSGCTCGSNQQNKPGSVTDSANLDTTEKTGLQSDSENLQGSAPVEPEHFDTATQHWLLESLHKTALSKGNFTLHEPDNNSPAAAADTSSAASGGNEGANLGPVSEFTPSKNFYNNYRKVIRWSPDSSHFVDFGSYNLMVVKHPDGTTSLEGGEPDTKVVLVDPKTKKQTQILFGGPGIHVLDVHWLDKQTFVMLYSSNYTTKTDTLLLMTDIAQGNSWQYQYTPSSTE